MLKSCQYCGRIHDSKYICPQKAKNIAERQKKFKTTNKDKFRWTKVWQDKRDDIKDRDLCLCAVCKTKGDYVYNDLSCHHIEPLEERFDLRLEDSNLITLCSKCHELAESGEIGREHLHSLINR